MTVSSSAVTETFVDSQDEMATYEVNLKQAKQALAQAKANLKSEFIQNFSARLLKGVVDLDVSL